MRQLSFFSCHSAVSRIFFHVAAFQTQHFPSTWPDHIELLAALPLDHSMMATWHAWMDIILCSNNFRSSSYYISIKVWCLVVVKCCIVSSRWMSIILWITIVAAHDLFHQPSMHNIACIPNSFIWPPHSSRWMKSFHRSLWYFISVSTVVPGGSIINNWYESFPPSPPLCFRWGVDIISC